MPHEATPLLPSPARLPDWPRALRAEWAAAYVGLSVTSFRQKVVPDLPPIRLTEKRVAWLREDLDAWLDRKAGRTPASGENEWMAALRETRPADTGLSARSGHRRLMLGKSC